MLSHSIKRARVGLKDKNKPIGSFILLDQLVSAKLI